MNTRIKSFLLLGCTLIAGITIGILGTSTWQHRRNVTMSETRIQGGLARHIERVIELQDEDQLQEVRATIRRAEQSFMQQRKRMVDSLALHRQILLADLEQILTPNQWERLEAWLNRERKQQTRRRDRHKKRSERHAHRRDSSNHRSQN